MSVYVDDYRAKFGWMVMCHMTADTRVELDEMADKIGVSRKWIQHSGDWDEHYDICLSKRKEAVALGAVQVSSRDLVKGMLARWRKAICLE